MKRFINAYFQMINPRQKPAPKAVLKPPDTASDTRDRRDFEFVILVHPDPFLYGVFLPESTGFSDGTITGRYSGEKSRLNLNAAFPHLEYQGTALSDARVAITSDGSKLDFKVTAKRLSRGVLLLNNIAAEASLQNQKAILGLSSVDEKGFKKLNVTGEIDKREYGYRLFINPGGLYLAGKPWTVSPDNFLDFGKDRLLFHDLSLSSPSGSVAIASGSDTAGGDIAIGIKDLDLNALSRIIVKDTALIAGRLNADVLLKKVHNRYGGITAHAVVSDIAIQKIKVGSFSMKTDNLVAGTYSMQAKLAGEGNDISAGGTFVPEKTGSTLDLRVDINALPVKTVEAFSMGSFSQGSGALQGTLRISGNTQKPVVNGSLVFNDVYGRPSALNNRLHVKNDKIEIRQSGIYFDHFLVYDQENQSAQINGTVTVKEFLDLGFDCTVATDNFLVFNTTQKDNSLFYGRMIVDSRIHITGSRNVPVIESTVKLKNGSYLTFTAPKKAAATDKGDGVVVFSDSIASLPLILSRKAGKGAKGLAITSNIQLDKKATLRLLLDPKSNDSLVVRGSGFLHFNINRDGNAGLSGQYTLSDGNYVVSFESIIKRRFKIEPGGTITFNGDPLDADVTIKAVCAIGASPIDLVADQISGLSDADKNSFRGRLTFLVVLNLRGTLRTPDISFELALVPEDKGAMGGAVEAKLIQLNANPSSLSKQVFSLLVLGRFLQENPIVSASGSPVSSVTRSGVSSFLSSQLNQLGANAVPGVELNFDVQSFEDYSSGQVSGRTQVGIGVRKQLFNERLSLQAGGAIDVEGAKARQNTASDIAGNVTVEYAITDDGRYRLKGFRKNLNEDPLEGQLTETGVGIVFSRNFNYWKNLFKQPRKAVKKENAK